MHGGGASLPAGTIFTEEAMRKILITAAALTVGTSALAWQPGMEGAKSDAGIAPPMTSKAADGWGAKSAAATTTVATAMKTETAWSEPKADTAGYPLAKHAGAMGGPAETAADIWPTCRPGPGDDRCIQLYEPGVTQALAALKGNAEIGMGGPLEPAPEGTKAETSAEGHAAMGHGTGATAGAKAETPMTGAPMTEAEAQAAIAAKRSGTAPAPAASPGVGGPVETRTGYPACSATITDRCIQLHERGVTGRGN